MSGCVLAGIVTYYPDLALLKKNLSAVSGQVEQVMVVDNSSGNIEQIELLCKTYDAVLVKNQSNRGIAKALNQIFRIAKEEGYEWVLTLDQDSVLPEGFVKKAKRVQQKRQEKGIGIIAPRIYDGNIKAFLKIGNSEYDSYVSDCISSGSFIQVDMYQKIGGFDELLFIDMVDIDFCIGARLAGYKIMVLHDIVLRHSLGVSEKKVLFGIDIPVMRHSAERKYYMARNRILCARRYAKFKTIYQSHLVRNIGYLIVSTMLYERQKFRKCFCMLKGIVAGITMNKNLVMKILQRDCFRNKQMMDRTIYRENGREMWATGEANEEISDNSSL